jgi:chromate reductase
MTTILGISGSLRRQSYNTMLLRTAVELRPEGVTVEIGSIRDIPLYDGDVESSQGIPPAVERLKEQVVAADGLLLVTPEYNGSIPGVFKNAIDWLSRPAADIERVFGNRPVGLMGATPGRGGTYLSQDAWLSVFRRLSMRPWFGGGVYVSGARDVFDEGGQLKDDGIRKVVQKYMAGFAAFVRDSRSS